MAEEQDRGAAQVHWLIAGRFGLGARGRTLTLTRADFNEALEKRGLEVEATIADRIGAADTRSVTLKIGSLKDLSLKNVMAAVPELTELLGKADQVSKLKDPSVEDVAAIIGQGKLLDAVNALLAPEEAPTGGQADTATGNTATGDVDAIFDKGAVQEKSAKSAIDMFVRSASSSSRPKAKPAARQLRDMIEQAAYGVAADVLRSDAVSQVESAWRGLRFMLAQCPKDAAMHVMILETEPEHLLEDFGARERADDLDEPDCIFVMHDYDTTAALAELADFAEQELMPVVVGVSPAVFGAEHPHEIPDAFEALERARNEDLPEWAGAWDELRLQESTRWLCAVANRVALHTEGAGDAKRTVFGTGVWGIASMVAQSYRTSGGFARIFGKNGSLRAPASHTIDRGAYNDTAAPTEAFYAISPCEALAKNGVLGLGSARNSDTLTLVKAPMVRGAKDAVPLPAQILTGRVVRFASWVKAQLPEGCDSKVANEIYTSAASVFLFPGQDEAAHVRAATTNIDGEAHVVVRAAANPNLAGVPFENRLPPPARLERAGAGGRDRAGEPGGSRPEGGGQRGRGDGRRQGRRRQRRHPERQRRLRRGAHRRREVDALERKRQRRGVLSWGVAPSCVSTHGTDTGWRSRVTPWGRALVVAGALVATTSGTRGCGTAPAGAVGPRLSSPCLCCSRARGRTTISA